MAFLFKMVQTDQKSIHNFASYGRIHVRRFNKTPCIFITVNKHHLSIKHIFLDLKCFGELNCQKFCYDRARDRIRKWCAISEKSKSALFARVFNPVYVNLGNAV